jgi:hypothetical protein
MNRFRVVAGRPISGEQHAEARRDRSERKALEIGGGALKLALLILALALILGALPKAHAGELRVEVDAGACNYGKATDGSWWKETYAADYGLTAPCWSAGLSRMTWHRGTSAAGWRVSWVDLGRAKAVTNVPAVDAEANNFPTGENCDPHGDPDVPFTGCVGLYDQSGRARGIAFGPVLERSFGKWTLGAEAGAYYYNSWWRVNGTQPAPGTCPNCNGRPMTFYWDHVNGWHTTWYIGMTVERAGWYAKVRRYDSIYASRTDQNWQFIGLIAGPLLSVNAGYQWRF